jgi:ABC-2 type transport system ATP-binding protein
MTETNTHADTVEQPVIEARELSKWFKEVVAVNNLSVSIGAGVTGVLGPNGAGKSTFIRLALGLHRPSRGSITVLGEPPRNNLKVMHRLAYCPEDDRFPDNVTGYEFVYRMNRYAGLDRPTARERAEDACERVGMADRMDDFIDEYSRGMRQRIKLAQTLALDADVYFLDEPMAGLDPRGREEMFQLIRDLGDAGRTVIVSSHILYEVERVTDRVVLLLGGQLVARGKVRKIRELIDEHPHAVTVACREPRRLARHFVDDADTLDMEFGEGRVTIRTRDPNRFYDDLNALMLADGFDVESITCPDDNLQSVFEYLVDK